MTERNSLSPIKVFNFCLGKVRRSGLESLTRCLTGETKWIRISITKRLGFSKVLAMISPNTAIRNFNFNLSGKAKIQ